MMLDWKPLSAHPNACFSYYLRGASGLGVYFFVYNFVYFFLSNEVHFNWTEDTNPQKILYLPNIEVFLSSEGPCITFESFCYFSEKRYKIIIFNTLLLL